MSDNPPQLGPKRVQPAYKLDTSVVAALGKVPSSVASDPASLPVRELLRGWRLGLPSGQAIARAMGIEPISEDRLMVGKATESDTPKTKRLIDISPLFKNNAPLWYYILAEAQQQFKTNSTSIRLGPIGSRIVGEVFAGLMLNDDQCFLNLFPSFQPHPVLRSTSGAFKIADLLRFSQEA